MYGPCVILLLATLTVEWLSVAFSCCLFCCVLTWRLSLLFFFFFNDTATTEIYTLSLHDAPSDLRRRLGSLAVHSGARPRPAARHGLRVVLRAPPGGRSRRAGFPNGRPGAAPRRADAQLGAEPPGLLRSRPPGARGRSVWAGLHRATLGDRRDARGVPRDSRMLASPARPVPLGRAPLAGARVGGRGRRAVASPAAARPRGAPRCRVGRRLRPLRDAWIRRPLVGALRPADFPHLRRGAAGPGFLAARRRDRERPRSARLAVHAARRGPALHLQLLGRARDRASAPRTPRLPRAPGRDARPARGRPGGWKGGAGAPARDVPWLARRRASFARRRDDLRGASCALRESISPSPPAP